MGLKGSRKVGFQKLLGAAASANTKLAAAKLAKAKRAKYGITR
jgi:hypothetical protein